MRSPTRGQETTEYLISHGWAILVVFLIGTALWRLGILTQDTASISSVGFTFFKLIPGISESEAGLVTLYFQNNQQAAITIDPAKTTIRSTLTGIVCQTVVISPQTVPSGGQFKVEINPDDNATHCISPEQENYDLEFNFIYNLPLGGQVQTKGETGQVKGRQIPVTQADCTKTDNPLNTSFWNLYTQGKTCTGTPDPDPGCYIDQCTHLNITGSRAPTGDGIVEYTCASPAAAIRWVTSCPSGKCSDGACMP